MEDIYIFVAVMIMVLRRFCCRSDSKCKQSVVGFEILGEIGGLELHICYQVQQKRNDFEP